MIEILILAAGLLVGYYARHEKSKMDCACCYKTWYEKNVTHD
jgi:hypothetical protein